MKIAMLVLALAIAACSDPSGPSGLWWRGEPVPPSIRTGPALTGMSGVVVDSTGVCVKEASVGVIGGSPEQIVAQREPCDIWSYDGGFHLPNLLQGVEVTIRVAAPGFVTRDVTFTPGPGAPPFIVLSPAR